MALTITKAYAAGAALMESHLDNFRTGLHTLFNTTKIDSTQFDPAMVLTAAKFSGGRIVTADNVFIDFGTGLDAKIGLDASKNLVFDTSVATTEIQFWAGASYYMEIFSTKINLPGDIIIAYGGADRTVLQALSSYKKPVLQWASSSSVSISNNSSTSTETVLYFPTTVVAVTEALGGSAKYRQSLITTTANGYGGSDTGTAKGGRRSGQSLTTNAWYCVYACKVRSGTDYSATDHKFVMVFDQTTPLASNEATLDGYYGSGNWVYLGMVRYGYGAVGSSSSIIKFKQSNKGLCYFYDNDSSAAFGGLNLAYSTSDSDNTASPLYTLTNGMTGNVVPIHVGAVTMHVNRQYVSDWYVKDSSGNIIWRPGWQTDDGAFPHGFMIELPFITAATEYKFYQERVGTGAVAKAVVLQGYCDTFLALRRGGHGF